MSEIKVEFNIAGKEVKEKIGKLMESIWDKPHFLEEVGNGVMLGLHNLIEARNAIKKREQQEQSGATIPSASKPEKQEASTSQKDFSFNYEQMWKDEIAEGVGLRQKNKELRARIRKLEGKSLLAKAKQEKA